MRCVSAAVRSSVLIAHLQGSSDSWCFRGGQALTACSPCRFPFIFIILAAFTVPLVGGRSLGIGRQTAPFMTRRAHLVVGRSAALAPGSPPPCRNAIACGCTAMAGPIWTLRSNRQVLSGTRLCDKNIYQHLNTHVEISK